MTQSFPMALGLVLVLAAATGAGAQDVTTTRDTLSGKTRAVTSSPSKTHDGSTAKGRFAKVDADTLTLMIEGHERTFAYKDIDRVRRRRNGLLLGGAIGVGAGLAAGIPLRLIVNGIDGDGDAALVKMAGLGFATGILVDAVVSRNRTIFRRSAGSVRVGVQPCLGGGVARVGVRW